MAQKCEVCGKEYSFSENLRGALMCTECERLDKERKAEAALKAAAKEAALIIATTGNEISGRIIENYLGIARGVVVRSPDIIQGVLGGLKQMVGGNIETYARVCDETRTQAFSRMVEHAKTMNADAIIAMRYDATEFAPGITEVLAYGTAVKLNTPKDPNEVHFECPQCKRHISGDKALVGEKINCPDCNESFIVAP